MGASSLYARVGKRLVDLALVLPALIVLSPLLLAVAAIIRLTSRGPALFRQERLGRNATTFEALKFRTMTDKPRTPDTLYYTGDPSEVTAIGRLLRRTKMDELPQLINVLRGDMSIVGPRPQLAVQLAEFDENAKLRLLVRPGLTGMAQTHGNVALTWPERWYYDAQYVKQLSLALDLRLIARTFKVLTAGEEACLVHPPKNEAPS
ncbi:MAG TPA: sugar transferase [Thermoanaerobaculia bacterium]|nr:sugar transferase [Thermoanaerobaculia bacterium]